METTGYQQQLLAATAHLRAADPRLAAAIDQYGPCTIQPHGDYYGALVNSIIGQQLSVKAAASIKKRFCELFGSESYPAPGQILEKSHDELRSVGLSNAKARYIVDLAEHVLDGRIDFYDIEAKSSAQIIEELTDVKGVGEWTVHMFLMFCMGRLDVLPTGDLGVRNAVRKLYGFEDAPTPAQVTEIAAVNGWHPYETVASWYLWRALENTPS
ncbi:MAG: hypothetical protein JWN38_740 [Candidatus Saccharibacteria bacterium]|nr:hypothetical protein [Candidatus Saccharibacteria bacterium]